MGIWSKLKPEHLNLSYSVGSLLISSGLSYYAFFHPLTILPVAGMLVTSISIIFGLSITVASLTSRPFIPTQNAPNDPIQKHLLTKGMDSDNSRTVSRQKYLISLFLVTISLGVLFVWSANIAKAEGVDCLVKALAASFVLFASASICFAFQLPSLLLSIQRNEKHFGS